MILVCFTVCFCLIGLPLFGGGFIFCFVLGCLF